MPQATRKNANTAQEPALKPCTMPYHGTSTAAASGVRMNIIVVGQLIGGFASVACGCDMGLASESFT